MLHVDSPRMICYRMLGLLYTSACLLSCRHYVVESSPKMTARLYQQARSEMQAQVSAM